MALYDENFKKLVSMKTPKTDEIAHAGLDSDTYISRITSLCRELEHELMAYREGGLTEEILRRNDGYIKVGKGCVIALAKSRDHENERMRQVVESIANSELAVMGVAKLWREWCRAVIAKRRPSLTTGGASVGS